MNRVKNRLREIRLKMGLSVKEASKIIGISAPYLSQLETGEREIGRNTLEKICIAYGKKPNDIISIYDDYILIDETSNEFTQQDIDMLRLIKQLSENDRYEMNMFIEYLIFKHQKRIEAIENVNKKGN